ESDYDAEGRKALQIIPTPDIQTPGLIYTFRSLFNINSSDKAYSFINFDKSTADDIKNTKGSSLYFSSNTYASINKDWIAKANNKPMIQSKYRRDITQRISKQGGVGDQFQIGTNHETKYFYLTPTKAELQLIFGI